MHFLLGRDIIVVTGRVQKERDDDRCSSGILPHSGGNRSNLNWFGVAIRILRLGGKGVRMTVKELIERLQECDPDADVFMDASDPWYVAPEFLIGVDMNGEFLSDEEARCDGFWVAADDYAELRKNSPAICLDIEGEK